MFILWIGRLGYSVVWLI